MYINLGISTIYYAGQILSKLNHIQPRISNLVRKWDSLCLEMSVKAKKKKTVKYYCICPLFSRNCRCKCPQDNQRWDVS